MKAGKSILRSFFNNRENTVKPLIKLHVGCYILWLLVAIVSWLTENQWDKSLRALLALNKNTIGSQPWSLLSYCFVYNPSENILLPGSYLLSLYTFGRLLEHFINKKHFIAIYFLSTILVGMTFVLLSNVFPVFQKEAPSIMGPSIATYAIIAATATYRPNATYYLFFFPLLAKYIAFFLFFLTLVLINVNDTENSVMHLGEALSMLFGCLYIIVLKQMARFKRRRRKQHGTTSPPSYTKSYTEEEEKSLNDVDMILEKIARKGYNSLTMEEKRRLFERANQK